MFAFSNFFFFFNVAIYPKRKSEAFPTHLSWLFFQGWVILLLCVGHSQNRVFSVKFQCWCKSLTNLLHEHPVTFIPEKRWTAVLVADTMMNVWNEIFCILAVLLYFHTHSPVFTEICCFPRQFCCFSLFRTCVSVVLCPAEITFSWNTEIPPHPFPLSPPLFWYLNY